MSTHFLHKMSQGELNYQQENNKKPDHVQDIFQKKAELLCPECRKPVDVAIDALPPNILANRILEVIHVNLV